MNAEGQTESKKLPHHREVMRRWKHYAAQQEFRLAVLSSCVWLVGAYVVMLFAIQFATDHASNSVTDIVLSNIPVFDVDGLFVYGTFLFVAFVFYLCVAHPKRIPFTFRSLALFWIIRAGFVTLTHIAPFAVQAPVDFGTTITSAFFGADLFFSGHTGAPFLLALIFWREAWLRYVFLASSVFFAVVVLLGHLHYSIDVASAYFITYTIFCICEWLFPRDRALFFTDVPSS